jgi:hypothetical protein
MNIGSITNQNYKDQLEFKHQSVHKAIRELKVIMLKTVIAVVGKIGSDLHWMLAKLLSDQGPPWAV